MIYTEETEIIVLSKNPRDQKTYEEDTVRIDFMNDENRFYFENKKFIIRKNCVLCGSKSLKEVLNFKKTPLANSYVSNKNSKKVFFL